MHGCMGAWEDIRDEIRETMEFEFEANKCRRDTSQRGELWANRSALAADPSICLLATVLQQGLPGSDYVYHLGRALNPACTP